MAENKQTETTEENARSRNSAGTLCYAILKYGGTLECGVCALPLMTDFDHVRCCNPECVARGKKYKYPKIPLEDY